MAADTGWTPLVGASRRWRCSWRAGAEQGWAGAGGTAQWGGGYWQIPLAEVLRERVVGEGMPCLVLRCSPYHTHSALYPVIEHLQQVVAWGRDDRPAAKLEMLERTLQAHGLASDEAVPLVAALLSVPIPDGRYPALGLTPQQQRQQTMGALVAWLLAEAERQAVLAIWEDLHWADPSTLELLGLLIDQAPTARMLTLVTARFVRPPWALQSHLTQLTLGRLPHRQVEAMVQQLTDNKPLPGEVLTQVIPRTDGVPYLSKSW